MHMFIFKNLMQSLRKSLLLSLLLFSLAPAVYALDLATARTRGLAGEVDNGYLAIPPGASNEAQDLVNTVNQERRAAYSSLATKNNVTAEVSGQLTFEKRYPSFPAGTWVKIQGKWIKKGM